jgi:hypothetical protein
MRMEVIRHIGPLDESFFFYCEDVEWCCRARKAGYQIYYTPHAEIYHHGGSSKIDDPDQRFNRSLALLFKKCFSRTRGAIILLLTLLSGISSLAVSFAVPSNRSERENLRNTVRRNASLMRIYLSENLRRRALS